MAPPGDRIQFLRKKIFAENRGAIRVTENCIFGVDAILLNFTPKSVVLGKYKFPMPRFVLKYQPIFLIEIRKALIRKWVNFQFVLTKTGLAEK